MEIGQTKANAIYTTQIVTEMTWLRKLRYAVKILIKH